MTLLDRVRAGSTASSTPPAPPRSGPEPAGPLVLAQAVLTAAAAALVSLVLVCLPVLAAWGAAAPETSSWTATLAVASRAWLLAHFVPLDVGGRGFSLTPLLLAAVPFVVAVSAALRVVGRSPVRLVGFTGGYAACLLLVTVASWSGPVTADLGPAVLAGLLFPATAYAVAAVPGLVQDGSSGLLPARLAPAAVTVRRSLGPAGWGLAALLLAGVLLVTALTVLHLGRVAAVYAELRPGAVGAVLLTVGQLLALPNLALWAVSFLAGPGFVLGTGQTVSWGATEPTVLPLVPVLAALPGPGPLPSWMWAGAAVPVLVGALVGWRSLRALSRLSAARVKARTAATACLLTAGATALLTGLAGGGLGAASMQGLGAPAWQLGPVLLAELLAGAAGPVAWSAWRARKP